MPSDIFCGTDGAVTASGFNCDLDAWSADIAADEATWVTFASDWKKVKNAAYGMRGQFSGTIQYDASSTAPVPSSTGGGINATAFEGVSLTLTAKAGCTFSGTGNITTANFSRPRTDRMTGTYRFSFDGQPSIAWDETA